MSTAIDDRSGWHRVDKAEWLATKPYTLDCVDLTPEAVTQVRQEFMDAGVRGLHRLANDLRRLPTQHEVNLLRAALARHFNEVRIGQIVAERGEQ